MGWVTVMGFALTRPQMEQRRLAAADDLEAGMSQKDVADKYGVSKASVSRWAKTLRKEGRDGLRMTKAKGAAPKLTQDQKDHLVQILEEGPREHGWTSDLWTGRRVQKVIRHEFGVTYNHRYVPDLLHQLGFRPRKPKRQALEKDQEAKDKWLTTTWTRLKKT